MTKPTDAFFRYYEKARQSLRSGRLQLALGYLQRSIQLNPEFYDAYHLQGQVLRKLGRAEEAARVVRRLDRALGFDPEVKLELVRLECDRRRYAAARRLLKQVLRRWPRMAEAHFLTGELHRALGEFEQADRCYATCLEIDPGHVGARRGLNEMLLGSMKARPKEEVQATRQPEEPRPSVEQSLVAAGRAIEQGHLDNAIAELRDIVREQPRHEMALLALAQALQKKGDTRAALGQLEQALSRGVKTPLMHYHCALLLNRQESLGEARSHLEAALDLDPNYYEACFELGVVCHRSGDTQSAESAYKRAARLMPGDIRPRVNLAHLYLNQRRSEEAEQLLREVLKEQPGCLEAMSVLGAVYFQQKRFAQAERCYEALLRLAPFHPGALVGLARAKGQRKDYAGALAEWKKVAQIQPEDPAIQDQIRSLEQVLEQQQGRAEEQVFP